MKSATSSDRLCACNCGGRTNIARQTRPELGLIKGQACRFIQGHNKSGGRKPGYVSHLRKRPYEALYNHLSKQAQKRGYCVDISFEDFLRYTSIRFCHYCNSVIKWHPYNRVDKKSMAYHLDRKDNALGYTKDNVVVCCPRCNRAKSCHFTYEEWVCMTAALRGLKECSTG